MRNDLKYFTLKLERDLLKLAETHCIRRDLAGSSNQQNFPFPRRICLSCSNDSQTDENYENWWCWRHFSDRLPASWSSPRFRGSLKRSWCGTNEDSGCSCFKWWRCICNNDGRRISSIIGMRFTIWADDRRRMRDSGTLAAAVAQRMFQQEDLVNNTPDHSITFSITSERPSPTFYQVRNSNRFRKWVRIDLVEMRNKPFLAVFLGRKVPGCWTKQRAHLSHSPNKQSGS